VKDLGRLLVILGFILAVVGALIWSGLGKGWLGRLPGDFRYTKGNISFYFPLTTCILISLILTLLLWFFRR
jgi:uncharacterized protein YybS (DUF2232 family)